MNEQWTQWEPIPNLAKNYYIESVQDNKKGFKVILSHEDDKNRSVEIIFENSVYAYSSTNDTSVGTIINKLHLAYGTAFYRDWVFFKVANSNYIKQLSDQSYDIISSRPLTHFSLITIDSILDIVADYEPTVILVTTEGAFNDNNHIQEDAEIEDKNPEPIKNEDKGKFGVLPDGREVSLRNNNIAKVTTLETYDPATRKSIKIRYTK